LIVAKQTALCAAIARVLVPHGCRVEIASSEKRSRQLIKEERFESAIVAAASLAVPDLPFLREIQSAVPKLVLLAGDANDVRRLTAVFPDALVCPSLSLDPEALLAFLDGPAAKKTARPSAGAGGILKFEGFTLDAVGHIFLDPHGQEVALTRREFALLVAFVGNPGRVLSRAQLRNAIDGRSADAYDRSIDMLVARVRRKIEPDATKPHFIVTVPGVGYKFVPRVRAIDAAAAPAPTATSAPATQLAERRQLTILSCQILGFAALAAQSDPEDLEEVLSRVYKICAEAIARFGGTMGRSVGDGVVAYFGHPKAQENDAENAVRAALELLPAISGIEAAPTGKFRARVGIATGLMVVGERGAFGGKEPAVVGEALNLAVHMQQAAPVDSVVIGPRTRELIGRLFECRQLDPIMLEEGYNPVPLWRVTGETAGMPRFEALRRDGMLELVGRQAEIERLVQFWSNATGGRGQVVLLTGEAGIGKSRLVFELEERLRSEPHATIRYSGSPYRTDAPMAAIIDELQRSARFAPDDAAAVRLEKLRQEIGTLGPAASEAVALIAGLLSLPSDAPPEIAQLSPQKRKERTFANLLARIKSMAAQRPVLAIVDDVQWIDPTSLEFLTLLVERAATLRILLVIVGRLEFAPPWPEHSYVTALGLSRLSPADSAALIHQVTGEQIISAPVEAQIASRADGVPLFIEELTKSVLETGTNGRGRRHAAHPIPTTLHGLLLARFDRLERGKEVAQAGAVIGREFSYELLRMITDMDEPTLIGAFDRLVTSGLIFRRGSIPQATFVFKHALVRDAAYGMLLRQQRQKLHASIAQTYEEQFPETVAAQPELLAYHCREAGNPIKAISYLVAAAEQALHRSATTEALSHLAQARELIAVLPENRDRLPLELKLEITRGRALIASRGYTAPETRENYRRARAVCEALNDHYWLPLVLLGQNLSAWFAADYASALEPAEELLRWSEYEDIRAGKAIGHFLVGMTLPMTGGFAAARRHLEQAVEINEFTLPGRPPLLASEADGRITALMYLHTCLFVLGWPAQASAAAQRALAEAPTQRYSLAAAQTNTCRMHALERDYQSVARVAAAALQVAEEQGYPFFIGTSLIYRGWAMAQTGSATEGIELCRDGLAKLRALGAMNWFPRYLAYLAQCHEQAGDTTSALNALDEAFAVSEETGESSWQAELHRSRGALLTKMGQVDRAEICLHQALSVARSQEARLFELRAATNLANLRAGLGRKLQAYQTLAPVYAWFTEGFDCIDLKEAKALLDRIANRECAEIVPRSK
jgi:class 3 adenylate cyclase/tetratricopeptide (TPR) repeat protein